MTNKVKILNPATNGVTITSTKRAESFVRRGRAFWNGDAIRFTSDSSSEQIPSRFTQEEKENARKASVALPCKINTGCGVYLLKASNGLVKIGCTQNFSKRLSGIWSMVPDEPVLFCLIWHPQPNALESVLHNRYASKRIKGEWFALDEHDLVSVVEEYAATVIDRPLGEQLSNAVRIE